MTRIRKSNGADSNPDNQIVDEETTVTESNSNPESQAEANLPAASPIDPETKEGLAQLLEVIERTVERYSSNDEERELLRVGVTDVIKEALDGFTHPQRHHLRESMTLGASNRPDMSQMTMGNSNDPTPVGTGTTERAMAAATKGAKDVGMGFVEFTQGLITGTFNAVIKATIDQMKAYTEMVADLTKSLKDFASDTISEGAVNERLAQLVAQDEKGNLLTIAEKKQKDINHLRKLYALAPATGGYKTEVAKIFGCTDTTVEAALANGTITPVALEYQLGEITNIKQAIKYGLARDGMNQLRQMAREGMARIVITEGEIHTKLTFTMKSDESTTKDTHTEDKTDAGVSVDAGVGYGGGPWSAKVDVKAHYNRLQVNTVDEKSTSNINLATEMIGEVRIKFKTDYQPISGRGDVREADLAPIA